MMVEVMMSVLAGMEMAQVMMIATKLSWVRLVEVMGKTQTANLPHLERLYR